MKTAEATATARRERLTKFWFLNVIGLCGRISWSFPAAIRLPENVSEPRMTSNESTDIMNGGTSGDRRWYSAMPTRVTQSARTRGSTPSVAARRSSARDRAVPMIVPTTSPTAIHL